MDASGRTPSREVLDAAAKFRDSLVPGADHLHAGHYPMWYGWALYDAFVAGATFAASETRQSAWVSKGRPDEGVKVLCFWPARGGHFEMDTAVWTGFEWVNPDDHEYGYSEPSHWMQLPEKPETP